MANKLTLAARISLTAAALVVVAALFATVRFRLRPQAAPAKTYGAELFSGLRTWKPAGWEVREEPLGATELSQKIVERTLRFDDAAFLVFRNGPKDFALYLAYWKPGKVDLREVNAHTPDTCWMNSGWSISRKESEFAGLAQGPRLLPGEWRCYAQPDGAKQYVAFWHVLGGQPVPMWRNGFPKFGFMWSIFQGDRSLLSSEQYFIRISSTRPLEEVWNEPAFREVLRQLEVTGLLVNEPTHG